VPTRTSPSCSLQRATLLVTLIASLCKPAAVRAEIQVAGSGLDPIFVNWIGDTTGRSCWIGPVRIERFPCSLGSQRIPSP